MNYNGLGSLNIEKNKDKEKDSSVVEVFKVISNGLGQIAPKKKEDFKTASIGIRG